MLFFLDAVFVRLRALSRNFLLIPVTDCQLLLARKVERRSLLVATGGHRHSVMCGYDVELTSMNRYQMSSTYLCNMVLMSTSGCQLSMMCVLVFVEYLYDCPDLLMVPRLAYNFVVFVEWLDCGGAGCRSASLVETFAETYDCAE